MNYASDTSPTYTPRTAAQLATITGTSIQAATSVSLFTDAKYRCKPFIYNT
jgi:hypothetical protein